jgi:hypothetical protein
MPNHRNLAVGADGSVFTGRLYDHSRVALVAFAIVVQLASLPFFLLGARRADRARQDENQSL